jgi:hypothetical protein
MGLHQQLRNQNHKQELTQVHAKEIDPKARHLSECDPPPVALVHQGFRHYS